MPGPRLRSELRLLVPSGGDVGDAAGTAGAGGTRRGLPQLRREYHRAVLGGMASGGPPPLLCLLEAVVSTPGVRWEKVYARAWGLGEMQCVSDMAKGEVPDPSEMW